LYPSYSGGRDQEDCSSKPGQIIHKTLPQKHPSQKSAYGVVQRVGSELKPQYCKKIKERKKNWSSCVLPLSELYLKMKSLQTKSSKEEGILDESDPITLTRILVEGNCYLDTHRRMPYERTEGIRNDMSIMGRISSNHQKLRKKHRKAFPSELPEEPTLWRP
jgi:hypothetical protein